MNSIRIYRIILFIPFYLFFTDLSFSQIPLTVGDYRTIASGDFDNPLVWEIWDGTAWNAATAKPVGLNNIFIDFTHEIRLTNDENVKNVFFNADTGTGKKLNLQIYSLGVFGSLNLMIKSGDDFELVGNSTAITLIDWIYPITGNIVFKGLSRTVVDRSSWSAQNTRSKYTIIFNPDQGEILTVNSTFKASKFMILSGTVIQTLNTNGAATCSTFSFIDQNLPDFNNNGPFGDFIIEPGATLVSECPGSNLQQIIRRTGSIPANLFHLKNGANLILLGNNPYMEATQILFEGNVHFRSNIGIQNMVKTSMVSTKTPKSYHNLYFENAASKVLLDSIFVTGDIGRISGPEPTDGPTYLRFVGTANQQVSNWEINLSQVEINKPSNSLSLDNDLLVKDNFLMKNGQVNFNGFDLYLNTSGTGEYLYEGGEWLNLHNLSYNNIPSTFTPSNATFPFEDAYQGGVRRMRLTGNTPGGNLNIRFIEIPGANWDPMYDDNDGTPIMYQLNSYFELSGISPSSDPIVMELAAENLIVDNVDDLRIVSNGLAAPGLHLPGVDTDTLWARRDLIFSDLNNTTFTIGSYRVLSILPVDWLETKAILENGKINIYWTLGKEVDNQVFQIEASINGINNFSVIGELPSLGDTESPRTYSYEYAEQRPWNNIYYRIKQIDSDEKGTYSKVFRLEGSWKELEIPKLYPNPLGSEQLHLIVPSSYNQKDTFIQVIGTNGLIRFSDTLQVFKDSFDSSNLSPGIYFLLIHEGEKQHRIKFIKK